MTIDLSRRGRTRLVAAGATILSLFAAGCAGDATTAPNPSHREPSATARMDDDPPTGECRSGWTQADGRWVCNDLT
jgi:hypothetical protein